MKEAEAAEKRKAQRSEKPKVRAAKPVSAAQSKRRTEPKPFRLSAVERREESKVHFTRTVVETFKGGVSSRVIKERETRISSVPVTRHPATHRQAQHLKPTVAHSPKFASAARARHWKEVVDPRKHEKMEEVRRRRDEKRAQEVSPKADSVPPQSFFPFPFLPRKCCSLDSSPLS